MEGSDKRNRAVSGQSRPERDTKDSGTQTDSRVLGEPGELLRCNVSGLARFGYVMSKHSWYMRGVVYNTATIEIANTQYIIAIVASSLY